MGSLPSTPASYIVLLRSVRSAIGVPLENGKDLAGRGRNVAIPAPHGDAVRRRFCGQFSDGLSILSTTSTSTGPLVDSSFSPSCSWKAVKSPGGASGSFDGGGTLTPILTNCESSGVQRNVKSHRP